MREHPMLGFRGPYVTEEQLGFDFSLNDLLKPLEQSVTSLADPLKDWASDLIGEDKVNAINQVVNQTVEQERKEAQNSLFQQALQLIPGYKAPATTATAPTGIEANPVVAALGGKTGLMIIGGVVGGIILYKVMSK